jgi:predicted enzyme related to lactoylglutathione lyase
MSRRLRFSATANWLKARCPTANQCGFAHIAFAVDDVNQALQALIAAGGGAVGEIATTQVDSVGVLRVVYARDPEGNIIELQKWN